MRTRATGAASVAAAAVVPSPFLTSSVHEVAGSAPYLGFDVHFPSPDKRQFTLDARQFGDAWAATLENGSLVRGRIEARHGNWVAVVVLDAPEGTKWDGRRVGPRDVALIPPRAGLIVIHPPGTRLGIVAAKADRVALVGAPAPRTAEGRVAHRSGSVPARRIRAVHRLAMNVPRGTVRSMESDIGSALAIASVPSDVSEAGRHQRDATIVAKSLEYLRAESLWKAPLGDLAAVTGVSERRIQMAFEVVCGVSPSRYMRARALQAVHERLRHGDRHGPSISAIALDYGFDHLGRFSAYYRMMFGEQPSTTRRITALQAA